MAERALPMATLGMLRRLASRYCVDRHEAEDVVQDILLSAVETGRDCADPHFVRWACGAVRLRAKFLARSAGRRRSRETRHAFERQPPADRRTRLPDDFVAALPRSRRAIALLINLGMTRREIGYLLGLTDVALRQRIAGLRRATEQSGVQPEFVDEMLDRRLAPGLARRSLKAAFPPTPIRQFAIRDPDGLPIFFSTGSHVSGKRGNIAGNQHQGDPNAP